MQGTKWERKIFATYITMSFVICKDLSTTGMKKINIATVELTKAKGLVLLTLLMGTENDITPMKRNMAISSKITYTLPSDPCILHLESIPKIILKNVKRCMHKGTSLAVQWLRLCTSIAGSTGLITGQGNKIPHARSVAKKKKKKKEKERCMHKTILYNIICNSKRLETSEIG